MKKTIASLTIASVLLVSSASTVYADYKFSMPVYKKWTVHKDVQMIQEALKREGLLNISHTTTYYGNLTEEGVREFQQKYDLKVDGIVGSHTISKLNTLGLMDTGQETEFIKNSAYGFSKNVYRKGDRHTDVAYIQQALKRAGTFTYYKTTEYFGPITQDAVKSFQRKYGLKVDGIVGRNTMNKLESLELFADSSTSRGTSRFNRHGANLDWWTEAQYAVPWGSTFKVIDFYSGKSFMAKRTGGSNHADVETLTPEDTAILKDIWGGQFSWERRPIIVEINGRRIAASASGMAHAGNDKAPAREYTPWRSNGYGPGMNYDSVKNNDMHGHFDIHFKNSTRHKDNKEDSQHQAAVKVSAGLTR